jgi:hypothetical protein
MFGDWSETRYEPITKDGETFILTKSSGKSGDYSWTSSQLSDAKNNLLESGYEDSSGYKSSTKQEYKKSEDGSIVKIIVFSEGAGGGYEYSSSAEYDANWNVIKSSYKDSNGYSSSTERVALGNIDSTFEGYSVISKGAGPNGYSYESLETFDKSGNLVKNSYKDSSGYYSQRTTENQVDPIWDAVIITKDVTGNDQQPISPHPPIPLIGDWLRQSMRIHMDIAANSPRESRHLQRVKSCMFKPTNLHTLVAQPLSGSRNITRIGGPSWMASQ